MKTVSEKLKAIKDVLAAAFQNNEDAQAPVETPAPAAEGQAEEFADPAAPAPAPAAAPAPAPDLNQVMAMVQAMETRLAALEAAVAPAPGTADPAKQFEAQDARISKMTEAFKLQHQALEEILVVIGEFAAAPAAGDEVEAPTDRPAFAKRDGSTKAERVEKLVARMGVKQPVQA